MWEIYSCGDMPYGKWKNADVVENITNRRYHLPRPDCCPDNVYEVMRSCWAMVSKALYAVIYEQVLILLMLLVLSVRDISVLKL